MRKWRERSFPLSLASEQMRNKEKDKTSKSQMENETFFRIADEETVEDGGVVVGGIGLHVTDSSFS